MSRAMSLVTLISRGFSTNQSDKNKKITELREFSWSQNIPLQVKDINNNKQLKKMEKCQTM
jgi:hypothetical protein